jgi:hypothetical protein
MCGTRVHESSERNRRIGYSVTVNVEEERRWIGKSGSVKAELRNGTVEFNAILSLCGAPRIAA